MKRVGVIVDRLKSWKEMSNNGLLSAQDVNDAAQEVFLLIRDIAKWAPKQPWWAKSLASEIINQLVDVILRLEVLSMLVYFGVRSRICGAVERICEAFNKIRFSELKGV